MRVSSRAVIIENNKVLVMFRRKIKDGVTKEYFVIPGGGIDEGETLEQNVARELKEEMNIDINIKGYLGVIQDDATTQHYFHCEITNGVPCLGGEELERMTQDNYYEPMFVDIQELENSGFYAIQMVKNALSETYTNHN